MKALFEDNFHLSFSPTLVQPQYPRSKEHSSSIAADNEINRAHHVRRGRFVQAIYNSVVKPFLTKSRTRQIVVNRPGIYFSNKKTKSKIENIYLEDEHVLALSRQ